MKKDLIVLGVVFVPLIVYNVVGLIKEARQNRKVKKILKELGRWKK